MIQTPLRYEIYDWHQLPDCLSNASRDLKITVTDFIQNDKIQGLRISVNHPQFGTLFSTVINAAGDLVISYYVDSENALSDETLINELAKFGFFVQFTRRAHLSIEQLDYLATLKNLHFDKLRTFSIREHTPYGVIAGTVVVAFNVTKHSEWLANNYQPFASELNQALIDGSAANLSTVSETQQFDWRWLDYVANIDDILVENGYPTL